MKMRMAMIALTCFLLPGLGAAQDAKLKLPDFKSLADKATESVNISLSPWLLHIAGSFIDGKDEDSVATKHLLGAIKSIQIRSFQFSSDNAYSAADIDSIRSQLAGWSQIMQVHEREKSQDVDMYMLIENNVTKGFALIAREPREFTIINIVGSINIDDLPRLESHLHLPKVADSQINLLM